MSLFEREKLKNVRLNFIKFFYIFQFIKLILFVRFALCFLGSSKFKTNIKKKKQIRPDCKLFLPIQLHLFVLAVKQVKLKHVLGG